MQIVFNILGVCILFVTLCVYESVKWGYTRNEYYKYVESKKRISMWEGYTALFISIVLVLILFFYTQIDNWIK